MAADRLRIARQQYHRRLAGLRRALRRQVAAAYRLTVARRAATAESEPDLDIDAAFAELIDRTASLVHAAQASALLMATAYLRLTLEVQAGREVDVGEPPAELPGVTQRGIPLAAGMAALPAMVKAHIGAGHSLAEAVGFGEHLTQRFADRETLRVADQANEHLARRTREVVGWRGFVDDDACEPCQTRNGGEHELSDEFYRHAACQCEREWIVRASAPVET